MSFLWFLLLFALQLLTAAAIWGIWGQANIALLTVILAGEYLFMPFGIVQAALSMREGKIRYNAAISGSQMVLSNFLSVILALVWPSSLVLVLPRLLTAPLWVAAVRYIRPWRRDPAIAPAPLAPFISYGWAILGVEVIRTLRMQADKLLVGILMGVNALGMYFMAFNAGLSLATSFSVAFANVLFSHLCAHHDRFGALREGVMLSLAMVTPVVILQALLAPWYVPLLLGERWADLSGIVSVLCLAAIPAMLWTAATSWFRAEGRPQYEFKISLWLTLALLLNTVVLAPFGLYALAWGYLIVSTVFMSVASWPVLRVAWAAAARRS